jgi:hypothetical protein
MVKSSAVAAAALLLSLQHAAAQQQHLENTSQVLETPFLGQHVGLATFDVNNDGAPDILFAAGRHWVDQSYALINLGPMHNSDGEFEGIRFSSALPVGPPGGYYQIDAAPSSRSSSSTYDDSTHTMVLLVGGTCHEDTPNKYGSCVIGENTPARLLEVNVSGCSIQYPDVECKLEWEQIWEDPHARGDRNGGFAYFQDTLHPSIALLGQGGVEIFHPYQQEMSRLVDMNDAEFRIPAPEKIDPRSDFARYAGFASSKTLLGGAIAAGRRSDYDPPQVDSKGRVERLNILVYKDQQSSSSSTFKSYFLPSNISGEPYPGNTSISIQSTNFHFDDIDGDGVDDLLEATFLYSKQRVSGHPLPQRIHFLNETGHVKKTIVVHESEEGDAGRSVTTGQIFADSSLPDVVFASAKGIVNIFANLGVDESGGFRGLERRYQFSAKNPQCEVRDVAVVSMAQSGDDNDCWIGLVAAVACPFEKPTPKYLGENEIFYVKGSCEGYRDIANPLVDGAALPRESTQFDWQLYSKHVLKWLGQVVC